jgi:hypothetical protein
MKTTTKTKTTRPMRRADERAAMRAERVRAGELAAAQADEYARIGIGRRRVCRDCRAPFNAQPPHRTHCYRCRAPGCNVTLVHIEPRPCSVCGVRFMPVKRLQTACSHACYRTAYNARRRQGAR